MRRQDLERIERKEDLVEGGALQIYHGRGMSGSIFISYAHEDRERAAALAARFTAAGWSVWWDREIRAGRSFDRVIEDAISAATVVVVLWSQFSVRSDWVRAEAAYALQENKLLPVRIDAAIAPLRFLQVQTISLGAWESATDTSELERLLAELAELLKDEQPHAPIAQAPPAAAPPQRARSPTTDPGFGAVDAPVEPAGADSPPSLRADKPMERDSFLTAGFRAVASGRRTRVATGAKSATSGGLSRGMRRIWLVIAFVVLAGAGAVAIFVWPDESHNSQQNTQSRSLLAHPSPPPTASGTTLSEAAPSRVATIDISRLMSNLIPYLPRINGATVDQQKKLQGIVRASIDDTIRKADDRRFSYIFYIQGNPRDGLVLYRSSRFGKNAEKLPQTYTDFTGEATQIAIRALPQISRAFDAYFQQARAGK